MSEKDAPQNSNLYIPISECITGPPYDNFCQVIKRKHTFKR